MMGQELKAVPAGKHHHTPREYGEEPRTWKPEPADNISAGHLLAIMRALDIGRADVAEGASVRPGTVAAWLRGRKPIPPLAYTHLEAWLLQNPRTFAGACKFFGIPPR